jgi:hypothetical protein
MQEVEREAGQGEGKYDKGILATEFLRLYDELISDLSCPYCVI